MVKEGDLSTIFHPKRVRAPSVIITSEEVVESQRGSGDCEREEGNSGPTPATPLSPRAPLTPQTSISSAPPLSTQPSLQHGYSESATSSQDEEPRTRDKTCIKSFCSPFAKKIYYGLCITLIITVSWVVMAHSIKFMYLQEYGTDKSFDVSSAPQTSKFVAHKNTTLRNKSQNHYKAPLFTAWFCTNWLILFYPIYFLLTLINNKCKSAHEILHEAFRDYKEKGFTIGRLGARCALFCCVWVTSTYMACCSLRALLPTDVIALYATSVSCVYLLSWVILHEQFVGVRIVAVILCDTGIALLAYMDGITGSPTLGGVVVGAAAAAASAVFHVLFRKVMGDVTAAQRALFLSALGGANALGVWPCWLALHVAGAEPLPPSLHLLPWLPLLLAALSGAVFHLVSEFGHVKTYRVFVSLGLVTAVPASGALESWSQGTRPRGMRLAGLVLIAVGFCLIMFPDNWPNYIMRALRWSRRRRGARGARDAARDAVDYRTGYIRSHLRSPSGRVR